MVSNAPVEGIADRPLAIAADLATLAHAVHAGIRPAALLPVEANAQDPFVMALRRIEFESGRLMQAQILFLKGPTWRPFAMPSAWPSKDAITDVRKLWTEMLEASASPSAMRMMRSVDADQRSGLTRRSKSIRCHLLFDRPLVRSSNHEALFPWKKPSR